MTAINIKLKKRIDDFIYGTLIHFTNLKCIFIADTERIKILFRIIVSNF